MLPEAERDVLAAYAVLVRPQLLHRLRQVPGDLRPAPRCRQLGDLGPDVGPGLEDAARHGEVEPAARPQEPGQQVQPAEAAEVADRRRVALPHVDVPRLRQPLQRLADGRS